MPILSTQTYVFIALIIIGAIIAHVKFDEKSAHSAPGILITFGIFATFYGIALGLYDFNMQDVETSLPSLIEGIKLAFWASVVGIGSALSLKVRYALWGVKNESGAIEGATIDDLLILQKQSSDTLLRLQQAMVGDEDATLLTQLKLIRTDQNDRLDSLRKAFVEFAEKQVENNSKALIEALKEVIRDFNTKITEQFGDNFKQLNEAVGKVNEWQELYKLQMTEMIEEQKQTSADMKVASYAFQIIVENSKSFSDVADRLKVTIDTVSLLEEAMRNNLTSLATLIKSAKTGIPTIENKIIELVTEISNGSKSAVELLTTRIIQSTTEMNNSVTRNHELVSVNITELNTKMNENIHKQSDLIYKNVNELSTKTQQQVIALDAELSKALKTSLETLGQQLASLSNKFVEDYSPLTDKLRKIVELSKHV